MRPRRKTLGCRQRSNLALLSEGWLSFGGKWKLILGPHAHADWHWTHPDGSSNHKASELVRFLVAEDGTAGAASAWRACS